MKRNRIKTSAFRITAPVGTAVIGLLLAVMSTAHAVTYVGGAITINDGNIGSSTPATPYPSTITISGLATIPTSGNNVTLTLTNYSRLGGRSDDIDILLVGPSGASLLVLSDVGGNSNPFTNLTITLSDFGTVFLSDAGQLTSGTFKPTNEATALDTFPSPAPAGPYGDPGGDTNGTRAGSFASQFKGTNSNGVWSLYVVDDVASPQAGDTGSIGSWTLNINAAPIPEPSTSVMLGAAALGLMVRRKRSPRV